MIPLEQDGWSLRYIESTNKVTVGQEITCFRGAKDILLGGRPPIREGSTGRVWTSRGEFYPGVFGLEWKWVIQGQRPRY